LTSPFRLAKSPEQNHRLCHDPSHFSPANGPTFRSPNSPLVKKMGYDGVELACWGDHFEVDRALAEPDYCQKEMGAARQARPEMFRHFHAPRRPGRVRFD
jgi:hypothetical protein